MPRRAFLCGLAFYCATSVATAQFVQYTPPGALEQPQVVDQGSLEEAIADSRWRLGPVRLSPWFALRDLGYSNNVFGSSIDPQSDVSVTLGAGLRGYLRTGDKLNFAAHALPEYVWWAELDERRRLNGRYGAALFGYFNRLTLEAELRTSDRQQYISSEFEQPVNVFRDRAGGAAELELGGPVSVFGAASWEDWQYDESTARGPRGERVLLLARSESVYRGGLRYDFGRGLSFGLGAEYSEVRFAAEEADRSNRGTAPLLEARIERARLRVAVSAAFRRLDPVDEALFEPFEGLTGRFLVAFRPGSRLQYQVYGKRNLVYTIFPDASYYDDGRLGIALASPIGWRFGARAFYESGRNHYAMFDPDVPPRRDEVRAWGLTAQVAIRRDLELILGFSKTDYDSNVPGRTRGIFRLQTSVTLGVGDSLWF